MRLTGLNMTALSLNSGSYLGTFENVTIDVDPTKVDGRGAAERYGRECTVLRAGSISTGIMRDGPVCRISNLDISALTIGGTSVKPYFESGTLRFNNTLIEAEGGADEWWYGQAESTDYSGSLNLMADTTGYDPMALAMGALSGTNTVLSYTAGTNSVITIPVTLGKVSHSITKGDLQMFTVEFGRGGVPTAVGTALPLFALGLTGSAACDFSINTTARTYAGSALIASGELSFGRGKIEKQSFELKVNGAFGSGT